MNNLDSQYLSLLDDIIKNGNVKQTRSGQVLSVFGRMMRFNLKEGFPLLTTKKVFYKGIIHELLWFLKGDTNIKYLVDNNVNIWNDDAYRWFKALNKNKFPILTKLEERLSYEISDSNNNVIKSFDKFVDLIHTTSKDNFIEYVKNNYSITCSFIRNDNGKLAILELYRFGDLGDVYGKQWRNFNGYDIDQISGVIEGLRVNPDDRRHILMAWNPAQLKSMALPPCHYCATFYTRELSIKERFDLYSEVHKDDLSSFDTNGIQFDNEIPKRELSCSFKMRSNDFCCGAPFNIAQYALLTHMIAHCLNMTVGDLVYVGDDVHVYTNHIEEAKEQLGNDPNKFDLPKLWLNPQINNIDDFKFEDIKIENYESYPSIKYPLNVGL